MPDRFLDLVGIPEIDEADPEEAARRPRADLGEILVIGAEQPFADLMVREFEEHQQGLRKDQLHRDALGIEVGQPLRDQRGARPILDRLEDLRDIAVEQRLPTEPHIPHLLFFVPPHTRHPVGEMGGDAALPRVLGEAPMIVRRDDDRPLGHPRLGAVEGTIAGEADSRDMGDAGGDQRRCHRAVPGDRAIRPRPRRRSAPARGSPRAGAARPWRGRRAALPARTA